MTRQREYERKVLRKTLNDFTNELIEIPVEQWPTRMKLPKGLTRVYRNNQFIVEVFCNVPDPHDGSNCTKVMVRHNTGKPVVQWKHLQDIKNQLFGKETLAIQYLPPESKLIDQANMYWFFVKETVL